MPVPDAQKPTATPASHNLAFAVASIKIEKHSIKDAGIASRKVVFPSEVARTSKGAPIVNCALMGFRMLYLDDQGKRQDWAQAEKLIKTRVFDVEGNTATVEIKGLLAHANQNNNQYFTIEAHVLVTAAVTGEGGNGHQADGGDGGF